MYMIFSAVIPIFIIILAGIVVERLNILPESTGQVLSVFSIHISIPCLLFHIMCNAPMDKLSEWRWWLGVTGVQLLFLGLFYLLERRRGEKSGPAMTHALACAFCNAGFVGLPIIMSVYDSEPQAMTAAGLMMVASNVVVIVAQMVLMAWGRAQRGETAPERLSPGRRVLRFVRIYILGNAIFVATILGVLVALTGVRVWAPLDKAVAMIGYVSPPCMLFTLGLTLRGNLTRALQSHAISMGHQLWLWFWRLIGIPLVTLGALLLLGVDPLWVSVSTIVSATGTAIFVAAMAQLYQTAPGSAALTVAVTNLLSLFSLMGALALLTWMGCMPPHFSL